MLSVVMLAVGLYYRFGSTTFGRMTLSRTEIYQFISILLVSVLLKIVALVTLWV